MKFILLLLIIFLQSSISKLIDDSNSSSNTKIANSLDLNTNNKNNRNRVSTNNANISKFQDILNDIRTIKIELFGNPEENMDFYKRNKNVYETKLLQRMSKIGKILELEELLEFYNSNKKRNVSSDNSIEIESSQQNNEKSNSAKQIKNFDNNKIILETGNFVINKKTDSNQVIEKDLSLRK